MKASAFNRKPINYSYTGITNMKKNSKGIILYNLDRTVYGKYTYITEVAYVINCNEKTVTRALKSDNKTLRKRLIVRYH